MSIACHVCNVCHLCSTSILTSPHLMFFLVNMFLFNGHGNKTAKWITLLLHIHQGSTRVYTLSVKKVGMSQSPLFSGSFPTLRFVSCMCRQLNSISRSPRFFGIGISLIASEDILLMLRFQLLVIHLMLASFSSLWQFLLCTLCIKLAAVFLLKQVLMILVEAASHSSTPERVHLLKIVIRSLPMQDFSCCFCLVLTQYPGSDANHYNT